MPWNSRKFMAPPPVAQCCLHSYLPTSMTKMDPVSHEQMVRTWSHLPDEMTLRWFSLSERKKERRNAHYEQTFVVLNLGLYQPSVSLTVPRSSSNDIKPSRFGDGGKTILHQQSAKSCRVSHRCDVLRCSM